MCFYEHFKGFLWVFIPVAIYQYGGFHLTFLLLIAQVMNNAIHCIEWFSTECCKTKTKVITLANHKRHRQSSEPIKTRS